VIVKTLIRCITLYIFDICLFTNNSEIQNYTNMNNIIYVPANYFMSYHIFQHYMAFGRDLACTIGQIGQGLLQQIQQDQQEPQ
jgi:hypothetical protein